MHDIDISLIIPIYNSEKTLARALDSVVKQKFTGSFEVLCVIDPSKDKSVEICEKYKNEYPDKIRLYIEKERLGIHLSRNKYIPEANGRYICFLDADDELRSDFFQTMYDKALKSDADIVNCAFYVVYKNGRKFVYPFRRNALLKGQSIMNSCYMDACLRGFVWGKLYKKELLSLSSGISMNFPKVIFEDQAQNCAILSQCKKVLLISEPLCFYHKDNPTSSTSGGTWTDRALRHLLIFMIERRLFEKEGNELALKAFKKYSWRTWMSLKFDLSLDMKLGASKEYKKKVINLWKMTKNIEKELVIDDNELNLMIENSIVL